MAADTVNGLLAARGQGGEALIVHRQQGGDFKVDDQVTAGEIALLHDDVPAAHSGGFNGVGVLDGCQGGDALQCGERAVSGFGGDGHVTYVC